MLAKRSSTNGKATVAEPPHRAKYSSSSLHFSSDMNAQSYTPEKVQLKSKETQHKGKHGSAKSQPNTHLEGEPRSHHDRRQRPPLHSPHLPSVSAKTGLDEIALYSAFLASTCSRCAAMCTHTKQRDEAPATSILTATAPLFPRYP